MRVLPLRDRHAAAGAVWGGRWGWEVPARYAGGAREYDALRSTTGIVDLSWRGRLKVTGRDRTDFLQAMLTNDVKALKPGGGCRAAATTFKGRVLADLRVFADVEALWLDVPPGRAEAVAEHLRKHIITEDATVEDAGADTGVIGLLGPAAPDLLSAMGGGAAPGKPHAHAERGLAGTRARVVASHGLGVDGFELWVPAAALGGIWDLAAERGSGAGAIPVGLDALQAARIEAGVGWYGEDIDESNFPQEVGLADAISYTKGCYLGQEPVARIHYQGHVNRLLAGLVLEGKEVPPPKAEVTAGGSSVGHVTSAAWSPGPGKPVALALLQRTAGIAGAIVAVSLPGGPVSATVAGPSGPPAS